MRAGGDEGQAAVELALVVPLVALLLLAAVQVAVVARDQILVVHAAREGARAAAVTPDRSAARQAALRSSPLVGGRMGLVLTEHPGPAPVVVVTLRYRSATDVVVVGALTPDVTLRAKATMRAELTGGR